MVNIDERAKYNKKNNIFIIKTLSPVQNGNGFELIENSPWGVL